MGACEGRQTAEVDSGVASAGLTARVVAETANASPGASWGLIAFGALSHGVQGTRLAGAIARMSGA
jgi:hypothetical protein